MAEQQTTNSEAQTDKEQQTWKEDQSSQMYALRVDNRNTGLASHQQPAKKRT